MIALEIDDVKKFMGNLLIHTNFDSFYLEEGKILTYALLQMNGKRNMDWYDSDQKENNIPALVTWGECKKTFFEYIKGSKTPQYMAITLKASAKVITAMLDEQQLALYQQQQPDLFLQIKFENNVLQLTTGIAHKTFTMDRTLEQAWDGAVKANITL